MKHILFPTVSAADAFIADLQARGVVQPEVGTMNMSRRVQNAAADAGSTVSTGAVATPATTSQSPSTWTVAAPLRTRVRVLSRARWLVP